MNIERQEEFSSRVSGIRAKVKSRTAGQKSDEKTGVRNSWQESQRTRRQGLALGPEAFESARRTLVVFTRVLASCFSSLLLFAIRVCVCPSSRARPPYARDGNQREKQEALGKRPGTCLGLLVWPLGSFLFLFSYLVQHQDVHSVWLLRSFARAQALSLSGTRGFARLVS